MSLPSLSARPLEGLSAIASRRLLLALALIAPACAEEAGNVPPVAVAGPDQAVSVTRALGQDGLLTDVFEEVELSGEGSYDPDGLIAKYFWTFDTIPVGSRVTYESLEPNHDLSPITRFTPDAEGFYGLTLQVFDGQLVSSEDYVMIEVVRVNHAPVALAGSDRNGVVGESIGLDGSSSSDQDGEFLSYRWELLIRPEASQLSSASIVYPSTPFPRLTPDVAGVYALSLVVSDGLLDSEPDFVTITAQTGNLPPVVLPGESANMTPCWDNPTTLDGSSSYDPEGDPLSFSWSVLEVPYGSAIGDEDLESAHEAITRVPLDRVGLYVFLLTLDDGINSPVSGVVARYLDDGSSQEPPLAFAGPSLEVSGSSICTPQGCPPCELSVVLNGSGSSDPNFDPLAYRWEVGSGMAELSDPFSVAPVLSATGLVPSSPGNAQSSLVKVALVVSDCVSESEPSYQMISFVCEGE